MREAEEIIKTEINEKEMQCKPGCAWCCHQLIILTCAADAEVILKTVRERFNDDEYAAFVKTVREQARSINEMPHSEAEKHRWPCPMLKDGRCVVYEVRPVSCRSVFSTDQECCKAMYHAKTYGDLPVKYQRMAMAITQKAIRIQILINNRRPIDAPMEIRSLLLSLIEKESG